MQTHDLEFLRNQIRKAPRLDEDSVLEKLKSDAQITNEQRAFAVKAAANLVSQIRKEDKLGLMEVFLAEYGLSTDEGVALMCLAEALLRVPDNETMDDLIEDKIVSSNWDDHLGQSSSSLVNAATWSLMFTGKVLDESSHNSVVRSLRSAVKRLGEPVVRVAVKRAMKEMGRQFVLGESIESALKTGKKSVAKGYTYSFDMLGEAALTSADAKKYLESYKHAIKSLNADVSTDDTRKNHGISIKLSALHPRYELAQQERVINELVPVVLELAQLAKSGNLGLNIDAEEADRLDLSLDVIQKVFEHPSLAGWDGFGVVVQAYNKSASFVLDWLHALAEKNDRRIMVRLVKGAYWDSEIKRAQVEGLNHFPVYTRKSATDISYMCCAKKLILMSDRIYPQFATHNAHTVAAIMQLAGDTVDYEFQRLHGMGDGVYKILVEQKSARCRIYAPVGKHRDLLAYLVRRLLENGANSSFVNQIVDLDISVDEVVADPFETLPAANSDAILEPSNLFKPERNNSQGWDLHDRLDLQKFSLARENFKATQWHASPLLADAYSSTETLNLINPADSRDIVGSVIEANSDDVNNALQAAQCWTEHSVAVRAAILNKVADLFEQSSGEIFALLTREAGKSSSDGIAEIREAVDFLRYYSAQALKHSDIKPRGVFACISPWNFPLAIFTGQICAALAAGNGVLAKPAESTPLIAFLAVKLFHQAGVPKNVLQLLTGQGASVGATLVSSPKVSGVCFTGSTATGIRINKSMAENLKPDAPLIAETGGLNAMIVDSTALPEQAIQDIVRSSFQSAGQRCSALRLLYLQEDIAKEFMHMLYGAMDELDMGNPWEFTTDVGPLISSDAHQEIQAYVDKAADESRVLKQLSSDSNLDGHFIGPAVISVQGIGDMPKEIFGPVLHIATFPAEKIENIVNDLNASGYGLTFGLHTRINSRVEKIINSLNVGNIYVNRDQIGAVVGSQPFGGENLSGTGPKAGGPHYLKRFMATEKAVVAGSFDKNLGQSVSIEQVQKALDTQISKRTKLNETELPGPTGESNKLYEYAKGVVLCLGSSLEAATQQAKIAQGQGCQTLIVCPGATGEHVIDGFLERDLLTQIKGVHVVALWSDEPDLTDARKALAARDGMIMPLVSDDTLASACVLERHVCINTTAAGGNASLLAMVS